LAQGKKTTTPLSNRVAFVGGVAQLADCLTKKNERKVILQLLMGHQRWRLIHDEKFVSGRKMKKQEMLKKISEQEAHFVEEVARMANACMWPWQDHEEPRSMGDEQIRLPLTTCNPT